MPRDDSKEKFVHDCGAAWDKVMNLDWVNIGASSG